MGTSAWHEQAQQDAPAVSPAVSLPDAVVVSDAGGTPAVSPTRLRRSGALVAVATTGANVLSYGLMLVLAASLGPAGYGTVGALLGAGVIGAVPALALQLQMARTSAGAAAGAGGRGGPAEPVARPVAVGLLLMATAWCLSPLVVGGLHLDAYAAVFWLGVMLFGTTLSSGYLGVLQGHERFARYAVAALLLGAARCVGGVLAAVSGWAVVGTMAALACATVLAGLATGALAREWSPTVPAWRDLGWVRPLVTASSAVAALIVLTNVDVLLARHFLTSTQSGVWIFGSLFAKACYWGPQFIAVVAYPRLTDAHGHARLMSRALALTAGLGLAATVTAYVLGKTGLASLVGADYAAALRSAWAFALYGTMLAVVHLLLVGGVARGSTRFGRWVWVAVGAQVLVVAAWAHSDVREMLVALIGVTGALLCIGIGALVTAARRGPGGTSWAPPAWPAAPARGTGARSARPGS